QQLGDPVPQRRDRPCDGLDQRPHPRLDPLLERVEQTAEQRTETEQRQQVAQGPRERGDQGVPRGMSGALRVPGGRRGALRRNEHRPAEAVTDLDLTGAAEPGGADRDHLRLLVAAVLARAAHGAAQRREPLLEREAEIVLALPPGVRAAVGRAFPTRPVILGRPLRSLLLLPGLPGLLLGLRIVFDPIDEHGERRVEQAVAGVDQVVVVPGAAAVADVGGEAAVRTVRGHEDMLASAGTGTHPPVGRVRPAQVRRSSEVGAEDPEYPSLPRHEEAAIRDPETEAPAYRDGADRPAPQALR